MTGISFSSPNLYLIRFILFNYKKMKKRKINYADWQTEIVYWMRKELIKIYRGAITVWDVITIELED